MKKKFIRLGLGFLDVSCALLILWYNPLSDAMMESIISSSGGSIYQEGIAITLWIWGVVIVGILVGISLLFHGIRMRSEETGIIQMIKGQLLFTIILGIVASMLFLQLFVFS